MSEAEFAEAMRELRAEFAAPSEVAEITARVLEALWAENRRTQQILQDRFGIIPSR
jgi:hypothetical protein